MQLPVHLIKDELKEFETRFKEAVKSQTPLLDRIMRYIVKYGGHGKIFLVVAAHRFAHGRLWASKKCGGHFF